MVHENYETRSSKLSDENAKCLQLLAVLPELASKLERLDRFH